MSRRVRSYWHSGNPPSRQQLLQNASVVKLLRLRSASNALALHEDPRDGLGAGQLAQVRLDSGPAVLLGRQVDPDERLADLFEAGTGPGAERARWLGEDDNLLARDERLDAIGRGRHFVSL